MNYEDDIRIDETALDLEWLDQAKLMMKYVRYAAKARMELDLAKERLDSVKAELDKNIRMNPEKYDLAKVTDAAVSATLLGLDDYTVANQTVIEAKYEADIASGAVRAFEQRKDALENLVKLHGQQYFAGPKLPRDLQWERESKQKQVDDSIASKVKIKRTT